MGCLVHVADEICQFLSVHEAFTFTSVCKSLRAELKHAGLYVDLSQIDWSHPKSLSALLTLKRVQKLSLKADSSVSLSSKSPKRQKSEAVTSLIQGCSNNLKELILLNDVTVDSKGFFDPYDKNSLIKSLSAIELPQLKRVFIQEQSRCEEYDGVRYEDIQETPHHNVVQSLEVSWTGCLISLTWFGFEIKTCHELFNVLLERPAALLSDISVNYIDGEKLTQSMDTDLISDPNNSATEKIFSSAEKLHESISQYIKLNGQKIRRCCFEHFLFKSFATVAVFSGSLTSGYCPLLEDLSFNHCRININREWNGKVVSFLPPYANLKSISLCNNRFFGIIPPEMYYHRVECIRSAMMSKLCSMLKMAASPDLSKFAYTASRSSEYGCSHYDCEIYGPLIQKLKSYGQLEELTLQKNGVEHERLSILRDMASFWPHMKNVTLVGIEISDINHPLHCKAQMKRLTHLKIKHSNLLPGSIQKLNNLIVISIPCLQHLNLSGNKIGDEGVKRLFQVLKTLKYVEGLELRWIDLTPDGLKQLLKWIIQMPKAVKVDVLETFLINMKPVETLLGKSVDGTVLTYGPSHRTHFNVILQRSFEKNNEVHIRSFLKGDLN